MLGAQTEIPHVDSATHGVETPTPLFGCCLMESVRREICLFGQRRGPTAPGEDAVSCPDEKIIHIYATSTIPVADTEIPRVYTIPYHMETPTPLAGRCLI